MFPKRSLLLLAILFLGASACLKPQGDAVNPSTAEQNSAALELKETEAPQIKRTRALLLRNSLAKILNLNPQGMCLELGRLPCIDLVHKVSLGGMNAYGNAQYLYPEAPSLTSPIAFDRVVLSACIQRSQIDLMNPAQALIFQNIRLSADGRLIRDEAVPNAIKTLYQRAYLRDASASEIAHLTQLYESIYAEQPVGVTINWMILSCYAVLSSVESAFY